MSADFAHMSSVRAHASVVSTQKRRLFLRKVYFHFPNQANKRNNVRVGKKSETMKIQFKYISMHAAYTLNWAGTSRLCCGIESRLTHLELSLPMLLPSLCRLFAFPPSSLLLSTFVVVYWTWTDCYFCTFCCKFMLVSLFCIRTLA